jgi:hypothetical protein
MEKKSQSTGEASASAAANAKETVRAIYVADRITQDILKQRPAIAAAIVAKRIERSDYTAIAQALAEMLETAGATTEHIRRSVVHRICKLCLSEPLAKVITHDIMARRPSNLTSDAREKGIKTSELYPWTQEIDAELQAVAASCIHADRPFTGAKDWNAVAKHMRDQRGITLTGGQWRQRWVHLRKRSKRQSAAESARTEEQGTRDVRST